MPTGTHASFSLQTNGLLLTDAVLDGLCDDGVGVSLSLDGPPRVNDLHRLDLQGRSSAERAELALHRLLRRPEAFTGVIAVIDPDVPPSEVLGYFGPLGLPALDLLLPDANHNTPPPGRADDPDRYARWLVGAFDYWFDTLPDLPLRTFDAVLGAVAGLPSGTDAFGFGDVSVLTIETDGTYHDLDVLKITEEGPNGPRPLTRVRPHRACCGVSRAR